MRAKAAAALGVVVLLGGCSGIAEHLGGAPPCVCPQPIHYSAAQLKAIEKAREALPRDSILHQVLIDYENERDDLRYCRGAEPQR